MLKGANVLLLDEPTNDLDLLTRQILEAALMDYDGCAVVATHDRAFLDRVCDRVVALDGDGTVVGYASRLQHLAARQDKKKADAAALASQKTRSAASPAPSQRATPTVRTRRSFKENQEYESLPVRIEAAELEQEQVSAALSDPATYQPGGEDALSSLSTRAQSLPGEIQSL